MTIKDNNGTSLSDDDTVVVITDLEVKGTLVTLKPGSYQEYAFHGR